MGTWNLPVLFCNFLWVYNYFRIRRFLLSNTQKSSLSNYSATICLYLCSWDYYFYIDFLKFIVRGEGREKERERNVNVWLPLVGPLLETWPATQARALTGPRTGKPLLHSPALNPLSRTSQVYSWDYLHIVCVRWKHSLMLCHTSPCKTRRAVGSLKSALAGVFIPQKSANATNKGSPVTTPSPLLSLCQQPVVLGVKIGCPLSAMLMRGRGWWTASRLQTSKLGNPDQGVSSCAGSP